ncbi:hypothetical protein AB7M38_001403 [Bradyrhizobium diazoefficiens]
MLAQEEFWLPAELADLADRLRRPFRRRPREEDIRAGIMQRDDLRVDRGIADLIGLVGDDHAGLVAEPVLQTLELVLAGVVVLPEHRDLAVRKVIADVFGVDPALALVIRLEAHRPGKVPGIAELGAAGRDEELRHLLGVHIFHDRGVRGCAERLEDQQNLVALDQLARLLDRLRRRIGVVIADEVDLAAVDAALVVDHPEERGLSLSDHAIGRGRPAIGHDVADLDVGVAGAGVVFLLRRGRCRGQHYGSKHGEGSKVLATTRHRSLPCIL